MSKGVANAHDVSFSAADVLSGMHGAIGLLAALRVRDQTGIGQHIDIAMMDVMTFSSDGAQAILDDVGHEPRGAQLFDAAGGPILLAGETKWFWHQLSKIHGLVDPGSSERTVPEKKADRHQIITDWLLSFDDRESLVAALDEANLAWGNLRQLGAVLDSPTLQHRDTIATIDNRDGGSRQVVRSPYKMSESDTREPGLPAMRGEHNYDVLNEWLDMSLTEIDGLVADDVLLHDEWAAQGKD